MRSRKLLLGESKFGDTPKMGRYDFQYQPDDSATVFGKDQTVEHALADVIIAFEDLDDMLTGAISGILGRGEDVGRIVTSQLSFRNKVDMFGALVKFDRPATTLATLIGELCTGCLAIEEERNKIVHSKWWHDLSTPDIHRSKFTARAKHGLKETRETWRPDRFASVSAHCWYLAHEIDSWMWAEYGRQYAPDAMEDDDPPAGTIQLDSEF